MKSIQLTLAILVFLTASTALASKRSPGSVPLEGLTLEHPTTPGTNTIGKVLLPLLNDKNAVWNISCDYTVVETNEAPDPAANDPAAIKISLNLPSTITTTTDSLLISDYTDHGITASNGKLEIFGYRCKDNAYYCSNQRGYIVVQNYDGTGNFIISNCQASYIF